MSLGTYLLGLGLLVITLGSVLLATETVVRRRLMHLAGASRVLAFATLATVGLIWVHLIPGIFGLLGRASVPLVAIAMVALAQLIPPAGSSRPDESHPALPRTSSWEGVVAAATAVAVIWIAVSYLLSSVSAQTTGIDALTFGLPGILRWIQSGTFWEINQFAPLLAHGNYPNNGDVIVLSGVLPWHNDAFARLTIAPYVPLTGLGIYASGVELGAPRAAALAVAATVCAIPVMLVPGLQEVKTDAVSLFGISAGLLFLLRHARTEGRADLVLAGLAFGLAFGTKWYGASSVFAIIAVWAVAMLIARRRVQAVARQAFALGGLVVAAGGFWMLRNLVESGNPVFPAKIAALGVTVFDAPPDVIRERAGFTISDYFGDPGIWRHYFLPAFEHTIGFAILLIPAVIALALALLWRRTRSGGMDGRVLVFCAGAVVLAILYTITPDTALGPRGMPVQTQANTRYLLPALLAAAPAAAVGIGLLGPRLRLWALIAVSGICVDALRRGLEIPASDLALGALVLLATAAIAWTTLRQRPNLVTVPVLGVALALFAAVAGYAAQASFNDRRYVGLDPVLDRVLAASSSQRVGLSGTWSNDPPSPVLPSFGESLNNRVEFVGPFVRHLLREYPTCAAFDRRLREARFDLLVVGRGFPLPKPRVRDQRCAAAAGYREIARSRRLLLYRAPARG